MKQGILLATIAQKLIVKVVAHLIICLILRMTMNRLEINIPRNLMMMLLLLHSFIGVGAHPR
jgi:hypothetical protein